VRTTGPGRLVLSLPWSGLSDFEFRANSKTTHLVCALIITNTDESTLDCPAALPCYPQMHSPPATSRAVLLVLTRFRMRNIS
jgi:hypothetical protein